MKARERICPINTGIQICWGKDTVFTVGGYYLLIKPRQEEKKGNPSEKKKVISSMLSQGMTGLGMEITLNEMFDYYITNKRYKGRELTKNTVGKYKAMYNKNVRNSRRNFFPICIMLFGRLDDAASVTLNDAVSV